MHIHDFLKYFHVYDNFLYNLMVGSESDKSLFVSTPDPC